MKTAAIILTVYNMGEAADRLIEFVQKWVQVEHDLIVVDNASYMDLPKFATHRVEENMGAGGGWWYGIDRARELGKHKYYWMLTTSAKFDDRNIHGDPLEIMLEHFDNDLDCVAVQPGWKNANRWTHKMQEWQPECYPAQLMNPAAAWNAEWWNNVGGFDRRLTTGCGSDLDLRYKTRRDGLTYWVCADVPLILTEGIIYQRGRAPISLDEYLCQANRQMCEVLADKYGANWKRILLDGIEEHPEWDPEHA
jgi:GT2 family glycosyltransferase